jgi:hypothetical protein
MAIRKLRIVLDQDTHTLTAKLAFTVVCDDYEGREAVISLGVPSGTRVRQAALTLGTAERMVAGAESAATAKERYRLDVERKRDPLLVQLAGAHQLELRAYPLTERDQARIEITLELAPTTTLRVDPSGHRIDALEVVTATKRVERGGVERAVVIVTPPAHAASSRSVPASDVSAKMSLYAGPAPSHGGPRSVVDPAPIRAYSSLDHGSIRRKFREYRDKFSYCYTREVQFRGGADGELVLHVTIGRSGRVLDATVDGELDEPKVAACLAEVVTAWSFDPGDTTVLVNYPLRFQLWAY